MNAANPASALLARHADIAAGDVVVHLNCGDGVLGAAATAAGAARVLLADRNIVHVTRAREVLPQGEVLLSHGAHALPAGILADVVAISMPREKQALRQLLWDALALLRTGGRCYLAGANNEGARPAARALEALFGNVQTVGQGGGQRVVAAVKHADYAALDEAPPAHDEFRTIDAELRGFRLTLFTRPGVFSWDHVDEATSVLAGVMQVNAGEAVLDLGCGSGGLGTVAALLSQGGRVCMVDADAEAVRCAERTARHAGAQNVHVMASDVAAAVIDEKFDVVVTNPPFHSGRATDLALPQRFIEDAWTVLKPGGRLYLVANRTLPYEQPLRTRFGNVQPAHDGPRFKVLAATRQ